MTISRCWFWFANLKALLDQAGTFLVYDQHIRSYSSSLCCVPLKNLISLPFSVFCLFLVKNTFGLRFHFRLDRLLGQNIPLSFSLCALVTRLEISIAITASVYSLLLTRPNKGKINSLLVKVKLFFNQESFPWSIRT